MVCIFKIYMSSTYFKLYKRASLSPWLLIADNEINALDGIILPKLNTDNHIY